MRLVLCVVVVVAACDTSSEPTREEPATASSPEAASPAVGITLESWDARFAEAYCDLVTRCRHTSPFGGGDMLDSEASPEGCRAWIARSMQDLISVYGVPANVKDLDYHGDRAAACLEAMAVSCDYPETLPACAFVFEGPQGLGAPCLRTTDCSGDARCESVGLTACGRCRARADLGEPCHRDLDCTLTRGPARCRPLGDDHLAQAFCVPAREELVTAGASCLHGFEDGVWVERRCLGDLACTPTGAPGTVLPDAATCSAPRHTLPVVVQTEGARCDDTAICNLYLGLSCDGGRCVAWGDGLAGSYCDPDFAMMSCEDGFQCGADKRCASASVGAPCVFDWNCSTYACNDGRCVANTCLGSP